MVRREPPSSTRSAGGKSGIAAVCQRSPTFAGHPAPRDSRLSTDRPATIPAMTTVDVLHAGYAGERVGSTIVLVRDGDATIVVDPGLVRTRSLILDPLASHGVAPEAVTHVFVSHHHLDHTLNNALFPNAEVVDFESRFRDDLWLDHDGDGYRISPCATVWQTPGHTEQDASLIVGADDGLYAMTHCWWHTDQTPEIDPYCRDQAVLASSRKRILEAADIVVPGHGKPFRLRP